MREIKFRAWNKEEGVVYDAGGLEMNRGRIEIKLFGRFNRDNFGIVELMQYTGLKDKNGKEIYEGDIVREYEDYFSSDPEYTPEVLGDYLVKWDFNGFWLDNREANEYGFGDTDFIEVIGNIYESPELIKTT